MVKIGNEFSHSVQDDCGVPPGSRYGASHVLVQYDIIKAHGPRLSCVIYADDIQVYLIFPPNDREKAICGINNIAYLLMHLKLR